MTDFDDPMRDLLIRAIEGDEELKELFIAYMKMVAEMGSEIDLSASSLT